jgi:hypothetical protein
LRQRHAPIVSFHAAEILCKMQTRAEYLAQEVSYPQIAFPERRLVNLVPFGISRSELRSSEFGGLILPDTLLSQCPRRVCEPQIRQ